jgi:hypothetical protein
LRNHLPAAAAEHKPIAVIEVKLLHGKVSVNVYQCSAALVLILIKSSALVANDHL